MPRVEGKVSVVTGGASGIGSACSRLLAKEGSSVVVADLDESAAVRVAAEIVSEGGRAIGQFVDLADEAAIAQLMQEAIDTFGPVTVLFNNAADTSSEAMGHDGPIHLIEAEWWDRAFRVDLRGTMLCCKHALPQMIEAGTGSIISTSSNQALLGDLSQSAYSCAKAAVVQLMRNIATQYGADGVRANTVSPGAIRTPAFNRLCPSEVADELVNHCLVPRLGEADDIAGTVLFLASDESSYITGHTFRVDGGQLAHLPTYAFMRQTGARSTHQGVAHNG